MNATSWLPLKYTPFSLLIWIETQEPHYPQNCYRSNTKTTKPFNRSSSTGSSRKNYRNSNRASTDSPKPLLVNSPNPIRILPETLVAVRVLVGKIPETELHTSRSSGDNVVFREKRHHETSELSDSSIRCTDSCSTELIMGWELPIARHARINIKKLKENPVNENAIESCEIPKALKMHMVC
ncbi:hypothetical protein L1887_10458 [Cichorium endivia]|nr:hypothetical protein L1887_10458 [Cichorium endivia]